MNKEEEGARRLIPADARCWRNIYLKEAAMVLLASSYDESKYFKAVDLDGDYKVRIKSVTEEAVGTGADKQQKLIVWFTNDKRGLVLNRVNNRTLRGAFGDDTAGWASKVVVVFPMMVEMRGKMVPGLRVRIPPPKHSGETAAKPKSSGNGQTAAPAQPKPPVEEELNAIDEPGTGRSWRP